MSNQFFYLLLYALTLASCSNDTYEIQIANDSDYEILKMKVDDQLDLIIQANTRSEIIAIEPSAFQEGLGIWVEAYQHINPDSTKVHQNLYNSFFTLSALSCSKVNTFQVQVNFNKETVHKNDFIEIERI